MDSQHPISQIAEQLASARCEQDLDLQLSTISPHEWSQLVASLRAAVTEYEAADPARAQALRSVLQTYLQRWQVVRAQAKAALGPS